MQVVNKHEKLIKYNNNHDGGKHKNQDFIMTYKKFTRQLNHF